MMEKNSAYNSWNRKLAKVPSDPTQACIVPTNICNYKCVLCARTHAMRKDVGFMDINLFRQIIEDLPMTVEQIYLHKQGESTLHPDIKEMMRYVKEKRPDIQLKLNTNGSRLTADLMKEMVKYLDVLTVSIWSVRPETYHKLHSKDNLNKVMDNLKELLSIREKEKSKMEVWIDYVQQEGNSDESKEEVINFFKNNGCKDITIIFYWAFNFLGFTEECNYEINKKLDFKKFPLCVFPWTCINILWDGKIAYCFTDPKEEVFLGDYKKENIKSIWNNERYVEFRKMFIEKRFDDMVKQKIYCQYCTFLWSSHAQTIGIDKHVKTEFENKEIIEEYLKKEGKTTDDFNPHHVKI